MRIRDVVAAISTLGVLVQPAESGAELGESKREVIRELIAIAGFFESAEDLRDQQGVLELMRIQPTFYEMMAFAVSEQAGDLPETKREQLLERLRDFDAFAERFQVLFAERVDFSQLIETVYPPLYDEYFSEAELRQMLDFYRTPVGRKSVQLVPALMQRAGEGVEAAIQPVAIGIVQQIVAEERAKLAE